MTFQGSENMTEEEIEKKRGKEKGRGNRVEH